MSLSLSLSLSLLVASKADLRLKLHAHHCQRGHNCGHRSQHHNAVLVACNAAVCTDLYFFWQANLLQDRGDKTSDRELLSRHEHCATLLHVCTGLQTVYTGVVSRVYSRIAPLPKLSRVQDRRRHPAAWLCGERMMAHDHDRRTPPSQMARYRAPSLLQHLTCPGCPFSLKITHTTLNAPARRANKEETVSPSVHACHRNVPSLSLPSSNASQYCVTAACAPPPPRHSHRIRHLVLIRAARWAIARAAHSQPLRSKLNATRRAS